MREASKRQQWSLQQDAAGGRGRVAGRGGRLAVHLTPSFPHSAWNAAMSLTSGNFHLYSAMSLKTAVSKFPNNFWLLLWGEEVSGR